MAATVTGAVGGVGLIVLCFVGSAALRMIDSGAAIAEELGALARRRPDRGRDRPRPRACSRRSASARRQLDAEAKRLADRQQTLTVAEAKLAEQLAAFETAQSQARGDAGARRQRRRDATSSA